MAMSFEEMLTGGHPNSLGRTVDVVERVLKDGEQFLALFACYESDDPIVRLRTSNAMKRIEKERPELLIPYIDRFIDEIGALDQASAQWTLAQLFARQAADMSAAQKKRATALLKRNLANHDDWIVLSATIETLTAWAADDAPLKRWLKPHLLRVSEDKRKSVASKAKKNLAALFD